MKRTIRASMGVTVIIATLGVGCADDEAGRTETLVNTDPKALFDHGRSKARMCTGCHGPGGVSRVSANPSLAGLPADYIAEQLRAFRAGDRPSPVMNSIAINLTDTDMVALGIYFAESPAASKE